MLFQFNGISGMQFGKSGEQSSDYNSFPDFETTLLLENKLSNDSQKQLIQSFEQFSNVLRDCI